MVSDELRAKIDEVKRKFVGMVSEPTVLEVERGAIKRFAQAVDDLNPLWIDEEYAKKTKYGGVISIPGFFGWPVKPGPMFGAGPMAALLEELSKIGFPNLLDGGIEYEFFIPVRPGDVLVSSTKVADIYERVGRAGVSLFGVMETTYTNQNGDVVAKSRSTLICRP